jgi:hypothetical protein
MEEPREHIVDILGAEEHIDKSAMNTIETINNHRKSVHDKLQFLRQELDTRAVDHDKSKLLPPEINWLIEMDREPKYKYGTPEYFDKMHRWQKFFDHHYAENRHHPDHFVNGVNDMTLVDLCEYLIDIISYFDEMHVDDAIKTIELQKERFGLDDQLCMVLKNTLLEYFTWVGNYEPKFNGNEGIK